MFTEDFADKPEVIRAAQVCGARVTEGLFPRWMVDQYYADGKITVKRIDAFKYSVSARSSDGKTHTIVCRGEFDGTPISE